ncbi:MAG: hypothetical protein LBI19_09115 [Oscillospiraceae bacterium]|jgi:hypothetical protein|nr:hypothetical protein [Oscillospiraceae bacterium]
MKKLTLLLCLPILGLCFAACAEDSGGTPASIATLEPAPISTPPESPSPPDEPSPSPALGYEPIQLDLSQIIIDIDWPEPPQSYAPEFKVFPLNSSSGHWKTYISAPITFIDEQLNPIPLPFEPMSYSNVRAFSDDGTYTFTNIAYTLWNGQGHVLMLADGTVPRGADGDYIYLYDYYESSFIVIGSLIITGKLEGEDPETWVYRMGLYDLEARQEVLPREYDAIESIQNNFLYVRKGELSWLLDAEGNELYAFAEGETYGIDSPSRQSMGSHFYIDTEKRFFCRIPVINGEQFPTLEMFGDFYVTRNRGGTVAGPLYVFDRTGLEIHRVRQFWHVVDDELIISTTKGFEVMDKSGNVRLFPVSVIRQVTLARLIGDEVHWSQFDYDLGTETHHAIDEASNMRVTERPEPPSYTFHNFNGPVYYDADTWQYILRGADGQILLETDDYLWYTGGDFVVRSRPVYDDGMRRDCSEPYAVYNLDGDLLLDGIDIFGVIYESPAPNGGMFVYLDENTCVLLTPDGRTVPVHNAPVVGKAYHG